jgi:hypothetical protein
LTSYSKFRLLNHGPPIRYTAGDDKPYQIAAPMSPSTVYRGEREHLISRPAARATGVPQVVGLSAIFKAGWTYDGYGE